MADTDNLADLASFGAALRKAPVAANKAAELALNAGAEKALEMGTGQILSELNLDKAYVQKHLTIKKRAKRADLLARIGATRREVLATRYGAALRTAPNKTRRKHHKGDSYRGIPKGQKAAGSTAWAVKRGSAAVQWDNAFFFKGKGSGAWVMAIRTGPDKDDYEAVLSPSVSQAWRNVRNDVLPESMKVVEFTFQKEFKRLF